MLQYLLPQGMLSDADGSASELGVEGVPKGGQRDTDDLAAYIYCVLQSLSTGCNAASVSHSDKAGEEVLSCAQARVCSTRQAYALRVFLLSGVHRVEWTPEDPSSVLCFPFCKIGWSGGCPPLP